MGTRARKSILILTWLCMVEFDSTLTHGASSLVWNTCQSSFLQNLGAQCSFVSVPLDHARSWLGTIKLQLAMKKHNASISPYQGIMLVSGGPSGLIDLEIPVIYAPVDVRAAYDWISFATRGSQGSIPSINCLPGFYDGPRLNPVPSTEAKETFLLNRSKKYTEACVQNASALLRYMRTVDIVKDIDRIRVALNVNKINFFGYSTGGHFGQAYASLFPNRIRRMLLDSTVDPRDVWYPTVLKTGNRYDRNLKAFFEWIAKYDEVYHLGSTACQVEDQWNHVMKQLETTPIEDVIGPADWLNIFSNPVKYQDLWPDFASAFSNWITNEDSTILMDYHELSTSTNQETFAAQLATQCIDNKWPDDWSQVKTDLWRSYSIAPVYTWDLAVFYLPCQFWPSFGYKPMKIGSSTTMGQILLVSQKYDPVQPYEGSLEVRRRFPNAVLVSSANGTSHASVFYGNPCIDEKASDYLLTGALPSRQPGNVADFECINPTVPEPAEE